MLILFSFFLLQESIQQPDWMADPRWSFGEVLVGGLGLLIGVVGIAVAIYAILHQRAIRRISYSYNYDAISNPLIQGVKKTKGGQEKLKIYFDDTSVVNISLVTLALENSGNQVIEKEDFDEPINIDFDKGAKILIASGYTEPLTIKTSLVMKNDYCVEITPVMLNPRDSINIFFLISNFSKYPEINGRIKGIKEFYKKKEPTKVELTSPLYSIFLFLIVFSWGVSYTEGNIWSILWGILMMGEGLFNILLILRFLLLPDLKLTSPSLKQYLLGRLVVTFIICVIVFTFKYHAQIGALLNIGNR